MKNTTLLLKIFQIGKLNRACLHFITPLFQMKGYKINTKRSLKQITQNQKLSYLPRKKNFDRILVLSSDQRSNARRSVFINNKRNDLIQYFNNHVQKQMMYVINLNQINQFVPTSHLIQQISLVMNSPKQKQYNGKHSQNRIIDFKHRVLFPFNYQGWKSLLKQTFPKINHVNYYKLQNNYFFMQITNIYMVQFSINPVLMYQDMKDFDSFLGKFNFIRYFYQVCSNNQFIALKYSERLIKSLKWRTSQTEEYLLMIIRSNSWQRFLLMVQDFCQTYEHLNSSKGQKNENKEI